MDSRQKSFSAFVAPVVCAVASGVGGCEAISAVNQYDENKTEQRKTFEVDPTRIADYSSQARGKMVTSMLVVLTAAAASLAVTGCKETHQDNV